MRIGDFCRTNIFTYSEKEKWSEIHYLDTGNITKGKIDEVQTLIPGVDTIPSRARRKVRLNDIIYSTVRPDQRHYGIIKAQDKRMLVSTGFVVISIDQQKADPDFIYYFLTQDDIVETLQAIGEQSTSAYPSIKPADIENLELELPSLEVQRAVGSFLRQLDEKCAANDAINDNLQQQAQMIYTSLFITRADPAWKQGHLSDLTIVKYGKDHKKLADGTYPVFGSGGIMRYVERPLYTGESVLIPRKGTLNNVMYVNEPFWSVDTMFYTEMRLPNVAKFVYHFVKSKDLVSMNAGSAVPSMTTTILNALELTIPSDDRLAEFEALVAPMYMTVQTNNRESAKLAVLRDALLPRLMSGEIDVSSIEL